MRNRQRAATAASVVLALSAAAAANGEMRTDRLSGRALERWRAIVSIVDARDGAGRPVHPRLHGLWNAVETSRCTVHVELPEPKGRRPYVVGHFAITKVDPEGRAVEGVVVMNLPAIDRAASGPGAARRNAFVPFAGLGQTERYAEVLGHELAHAAWAVVDAERTRLTMALPDEVARASRRVLVAQAGGRAEGALDAADRLERLSRAVEEPAEEAEQAVWAELVAGQRAR